LDIEDTVKLVPLLADDDVDDPLMDFVRNPNRLLKALRVTRSRGWKWAWRCMHLGYIIVVGFGWAVCGTWWTSSGFTTGQENFIDKLRNLFIDSSEDGEALATQLFVGSFMFMLHCAFEIIYAGETNCVMPKTTQGEILDPRKDTMPLYYRWFGLPSMWFTSEEAYRDLKLWIDKAHPVKNPRKSVRRFYPEEVALYALHGEEERQIVGEALKNAKLFDGISRKFLNRSNTSQSEIDPELYQPVCLNIELVVFDHKLQNKLCPMPGEFLSMVDIDGDACGPSAIGSGSGQGRGTSMGLVVRKRSPDDTHLTWRDRAKSFRTRFFSPSKLGVHK